MKQIVQDLKNGNTLLEEVPAPLVKPGQVLIRTTRSLVSQGTERMLVEFGKANLIQKAKQQPDKVKQVLEKMKTDGIKPTLDAVFNKLNQPLPLGYCNVGVVEELALRRAPASRPRRLAAPSSGSPPRRRPPPRSDRAGARLPSAPAPWPAAGGWRSRPP